MQKLKHTNSSLHKLQLHISFLLSPSQWRTCIHSGAIIRSLTPRATEETPIVEHILACVRTFGFSGSNYSSTIHDTRTARCIV